MVHVAAHAALTDARWLEPIVARRVPTCRRAAGRSLHRVDHIASIHLSRKLIPLRRAPLALFIPREL